MQLAAAASSAVAGLVRGPARPARLLGAGRAAIYLAVGEPHGTDQPKTPGRAAGLHAPPTAVAVLAHDAVRLPCGVVLPTTSAELPLTSIGPAAGARCQVGDGQLSWPGPDEPVVLRIVREWPAARVGPGRPLAAAVGAARAVLAADAGVPTVLGFRRWGDGKPTQWRLTPAACERLAGRLLGRGPGLTPAGDDVLAGLLLGCAAFGADPDALRSAVGALARARTTALSAALLWHAARGECVPEAAAFAAALAGHGLAEPAMRRLLRVGHTSGAALAAGLVLAAQHALAGDALAGDALAEVAAARTDSAMAGAR